MSPFDSFIQKFEANLHKNYEEALIFPYKTFQKEPIWLIKSIRHYRKSNDLKHLDFLIEFCRRYYVLVDYGNDLKEDEKISLSKDELLRIELLQLLIELARDLLSHPMIFEHPQICFIIKQIQDIFFHQVDFEEYPSHILEEYLQFCIELVDPKFFIMYWDEAGGLDFYKNSCLYFLWMIGNYFEDSSKEKSIFLKRLKLFLEADWITQEDFESFYTT